MREFQMMRAEELQPLLREKEEELKRGLTQWPKEAVEKPGCNGDGVVERIEKHKKQIANLKLEIKIRK